MHDAIIIGQGLTGSAVAWTLERSGMDVLVIDAGDHSTASKISAGLVTPFSGQRQAKDRDFERHRTQAKAFYDDVGRELGLTLWLDESSVRWFENKEESHTYQEKSERNEFEGTEQIYNEHGELVGYRMLSAARVLVQQYLERTKERLQRDDRLITTRLVMNDLLVGEDRVEIQRIARSARHVIFCQGYEGRENRWFSNIPDGAVRGEMLAIELPAAETESVQHRRYWLAEQYQAANITGGYRYLVGATYDRENLASGPTDHGQAELQKAIRTFTKQPYEVISHESAVRAAMKDRKYRVLRSKDYPNLYLVNGMGSRGTLLAPIAASELQKMLSEPVHQPSIKRINLTELAHKIIRRVVRTGETVVDATAGNGHDTLFLAQLVGDKGSVIAIDIQRDAIASTLSRVREAEMADRVSLHCESHAILSERMRGAAGTVAAVMFNLGYLPGADKTNITQPESTRVALTAAAELLRPQGVITVISYRGHAGGRTEAAAVMDTAGKIRENGFDIEVIESDLRNSQSPLMVVIRRRK